MLDVGDGHEVYVETVGVETGIPAVYLHGGPGSGCQPGHRRLFDPARHRAVLFDQRGAGRSRPARSREVNTTAHLIADMEKIRAALGIDRWLVVGGSWGATLAVAYAETHPERVSGIVLRATFLGTRAELESAFIDVPRAFRPELFRQFLEVLPEVERDLPLENYWRRILCEDVSLAGPAARAYGDVERVLSEHSPASTVINMASVHDNSRVLPGSALMEAHYFANNCFMDEGQLMANALRLNGIPGIIVQGRYDLLCPPRTAHALAERWGSTAQVRYVEGAGHSLSDAGVTEAVTKAIRELSL